MMSSAANPSVLPILEPSVLASLAQWLGVQRCWARNLVYAQCMPLVTRAESKRPCNNETNVQSASELGLCSAKRVAVKSASKVHGVYSKAPLNYLLYRHKCLKSTFISSKVPRYWVFYSLKCLSLKCLKSVSSRG